MAISKEIERVVFMKKSENTEKLHQQLQELEKENLQLKEALKETQAKLYELEAKTKIHFELIELAVDAIVSGDQQGKIIGVNQSAVELTGYSKEELMSSDIFLLFSKLELQRVPLRYDLLKKGEVVIAERLLTRKDGTLVPIEMNSKMMPDGTYHTFIRDISFRKEMEDMLRDSEVTKRALAHASFEAIFLSSKGVCIGQNNSAAKMFGYSDSEAMGRFGTEWIAPEERDKVAKKMLSGYELPYETVAMRKDGSTFPAEIQGRTIQYEGKEIRATALRDISARKKAERDWLTLRKLESLGTLAGGIAHDFNNILTSIYGTISLAKLQISEDQKAYVFLEKAEKSITRATQLTQKLLTFAKGGEPVREQVSLGKLVKDTVSFDLSGSNVKLILEQPDDLWIADVDKGQIQQVFSNLAINAKQAMKSGGNLFVELKNFDNQHNGYHGLEIARYIKVIVSDDGDGIDEKDLGRVFDPYYTTKATGQGLGLASVYSIINKHDGTIQIHSKIGQGTRFTFYLPASLSETDYKEEPVKLTRHAETIEQAAKVLIMDDDSSIRSVLREMLGMMNCEVVAAGNGFDAVELYKQSHQIGTPFDIVILDLTVPGGGGGREAVEQILEIDPTAKVIVSSGYAEDPVIAKHEKYGFKAVVVKPYTYQELYEKVSFVMGEEQK